MPAMEMTNPAALPADWRDFLALTKPRVMSLVVFTGLCGLLAAPVSFRRWCSASPRSCASRSAPARAARSTNGMRRTSTRRCGGPPSGRCRRGRMDRQSALHFGVGLGALLGAADGPCDQLARAALLAVSILFYVFIYTVWLKPRTAQNIVIGGAAGAFPPLIGWVAATGACRDAAAAAVRDHLPVDAAAFLGAVAVRPLGLCRRRHPDAPGRRGRREHAPPDLPLQPADGGRRGRALAARPDRLRSTASRAAVLSFVFLVLAARGARQPRDRAERRWSRRSICSLLGLLSVRAVRGAGRRPLAAGMSPDPRTRSSASASASARGSWPCCSARSSSCCSSSPSRRWG